MSPDVKNCLPVSMYLEEISKVGTVVREPVRAIRTKDATTQAQVAFCA